MMKFYSPEFEDGAILPASYQADRDNLSPALHWSDIPAGTQSFAITMHDPDAPTGGAGWWHWMAIDIPANCSSLRRGAGRQGEMPQGARMFRNDGGDFCYMGCMPPVGDPAHHYIFTLYALDVRHLPDIPDDAPTSYVGFQINAHSLDKASITGKLSRH